MTADRAYSFTAVCLAIHDGDTVAFDVDLRAFDVRVRKWFRLLGDSARRDGPRRAAVPERVGRSLER